jgi:hypothetical protein
VVGVEARGGEERSRRNSSVCAHLREVSRKPPHMHAWKLACNVNASRLQLSPTKARQPNVDVDVGQCRARARSGARVQRHSGDQNRTLNPRVRPLYVTKRDKKRYTMLAVVGEGHVVEQEEEGEEEEADEVEEEVGDDLPKTSGAITA